MELDEAVAAVGGVRPLAEALGVSTQSAYKWGPTGLPLLRVYQVREILAKRAQEGGAK